MLLADYTLQKRRPRALVQPKGCRKSSQLLLPKRLPLEVVAVDFPVLGPALDVRESVLVCDRRVHQVNPSLHYP